MLGISVYFQDLDEAYIRMAAQLNARYVMTSLQIPEEDYTHIAEVMPGFLKLLSDLNMSLIPDVSPDTFQKLGLKAGDFAALKALGLTKIRLDYGFDDVTSYLNLARDFELVLNASVVKPALLEQLKAAGADFSRFSAMHNFYPRQSTGLERSHFIEQNRLLRHYGMRVQAFICGDGLKRFPLYEGLPTLEEHRTMHPLAAALDLIENCGVDDVLIGDSKAKPATLQAISHYLSERVLEIPALLEAGYKQYYEVPLRCRKEYAPAVIRLATPRTKGIQPYHNGSRPRGCITMDNALMGRYCGEMQIVRDTLPMDARCNVIGYLHPDYLDLLALIKTDMTIVFKHPE